MSEFVRYANPARPSVPADFSVVEKPLRLDERLWHSGAFRKTIVLVFLAACWEGYARWLDNPLLFPTFVETLRALAQGITGGTLVDSIGTSMQVLLIGYASGLLLAAILSVLAITTRVGNDVLETLTAMFSPLPAIALLPLALIWFGLGMGSIVFVLIHSVLWPVALNTHSGFRSVSSTLRMVGRNYGLRGLPYVGLILIPAAFPSILAGLKIGWAFAWRTLIAAELVFGVTSGTGGLGWYIYQNKNSLEIPSVFAGLLSVIVVGLLVDNLVFRVVEARTIQRWGMHQ
jgi:NitT/TauT family transport system permease protein